MNLRNNKIYHLFFILFNIKQYFKSLSKCHKLLQVELKFGSGVYKNEGFLLY